VDMSPAAERHQHMQADQMVHCMLPVQKAAVQKADHKRIQADHTEQAVLHILGLDIVPDIPVVLGQDSEHIQDTGQDTGDNPAELLQCHPASVF